MKEVREELWDISPKWYDIGLELGLRPGVLDGIRYKNLDATTSLREMLLLWLKTVDPPPTWEGLACALESRTVGEPRLAEQLRTKYCKTEGAAGQLHHKNCTCMYLTCRCDVIAGIAKLFWNFFGTRIKKNNAGIIGLIN